MHKVFISYSHQDEDWKNRLQKQLAVLEHQGLLSVWDDRKIVLGGNWYKAIEQEINQAQVAVLLISADFLTSNFILDKEVPRFLQRREQEGLTIIPLIIWPCQWQRVDWLSAIQGRPIDNQPLTGFNNHDAEQCLADLAGEIFNLLDKAKAEALKNQTAFLAGHEAAAIKIPNDNAGVVLKQPYPGLKPMTDKDAGLFFGRDRQLKELGKKMAEQRFVIVVGASGAGKSSLVWAGLLPRLSDWLGDTAARWVWLRIIPSGINDDPVWRLAIALSKKLPEDEDAIYSVLSGHARSGSELHSLMENYLAGCSAEKLLIFIDQFEELFTIVPGDKQKPFIALLEALMATDKVRVVATMRAEFLGQCMESNDFGQQLTNWFNQGQWLLARPGIEALQAMIEEPARTAELKFEHGLVNAIVKDTGTESGNLPLMAFALEKLYQLRQNQQMTWQGYKAIGEVKGAIAHRADQVFAEIIARQDPQISASPNDNLAEALLGEVFRELVEIDEHSGVATRRRALKAHWDSNPVAQNLIKHFVDARLLLTDSDDENHLQATLEVAHEALFREWQVLRDWIDERKDHFLMRKRLQRDAAVWQTHQQDEAYRWVDKPALEAGKMLAALRYSPSEIEAQFLGPVQRESMLALIADEQTLPTVRASIGVRLALLGDNRPGVGCHQGLPDIVWCSVPEGKVTLEGIDKDYTVTACQISKYPITQAQYRLFIDDTDYNNPKWWQDLFASAPKPAKQNPAYSNYPVTNVAWVEVMAYCRWLSAKLKQAVCLPTEWEWQQAASSGQRDYNFPWGKLYQSGKANIDETYDDSGAHNLQKTVAVGLYPLGNSEQGVADLSGNIWEWCLNEFDQPDHIQVAGGRSRVVRGGAWHFIQDGCRAAYRGDYSPGNRYYSLGFRVCCVSPITITDHCNSEL